MELDSDDREVGSKVSSSTEYRKMPRLPETARVNKRPLQRPAIPSAYTSSGESKVVYVSAKTPFMSAVKRVDKLVHLAEKRAVQSAAATVRNGNPRKRQKFSNGDDIAAIGQTLDDRQSREEVVVKGSGKAISKALQLGLWFQQRPQYVVKLQTGTVESIDDIEIDDAPRTGQPTAEHNGDTNEHLQTEAAALAKPPDESQETSKTTSKLSSFLFGDTSQRDEVRVRSLSVIEVYISLK